jgi:hypothetical protein
MKGFGPEPGSCGCTLSSEIWLMLEFMCECKGFGVYLISEFDSKCGVSGPNLVFVGVV